MTGPSTALDRRLLATRIDDDYSEYAIGDYGILGLAVLLDFKSDTGINLMLGARQDIIDMTAEQIGEKKLFGGDEYASDEDDAFSWTASLSYDTPIGVSPYVTISEQVTVITSQMADQDASSVGSGDAVASSELTEYGIKGSFLKDQLFIQANYYEQERTNVNSQDTVTNQVSYGEGYEFELRYLVN